MTFYTFMMRNHLGEDSAAGVLAEDMKRENEIFPRNRPCKFDGWHKVLQDHLRDRGACGIRMDAFEECWEEYVRCEKSRLKKN